MSLSFGALGSDLVAATTYTFSAHAIGTPTASRWVIIGVITRDLGVTPVISSLTVAGQTATEVHTFNQTDVGDFRDLTAFYVINLGTTGGSTADIVVSLTAESFTCRIGTWIASEGLAPAISRDEQEHGLTQNLQVTVTTAVGDYVIGVGQQSALSTTGVTWTNLSEDFNDTDLGTGASATATAAESRVVDLDFTGSSSQNEALVVVSFIPALPKTKATTRAEVVTKPDGGTFFAGPPAWNLIDSQVAPIADFTILNLSTDFVYKFFLTNFSAVADNADMWIRTSTNNGASFDAGASDYVWARQVISMETASIEGVFGDQADAKIVVHPAAGNAANEFSGWEITCFNPSGAFYTQFTMEGMGIGTDGIPDLIYGSGMRLSAADVNAVRFLFNATTVATGTLKVYALKAS